MHRLVFGLGAPLLLVFSTPGPAADSQAQRDDAAIEKVVAASMEAARKMDWMAYAELVHPESLRDYKNMWLPVLQAAANDPPEQQADLLLLFDRATDLKPVLALQPKELFARSMKGMASQFPAVKGGPANVDAKILGTVREGEDLAHVVIRTRIKGQGTDASDVSKVDVVTVKRDGGEWKIVLPDVVRVMAETFKRTWRSGTLKSGPTTLPADAGK
jgi:ketosteroid isomerase-like protein